jgi:hypothetical protein
MISQVGKAAKKSPKNVQEMSEDAITQQGAVRIYLRGTQDMNICHLGKKTFPSDAHMKLLSLRNLKEKI